MSRCVFALMLVVCAGLVACGGDPEEPDPPVVFIPGDPPPPPACTVMTADGCEAGEKCTHVYLDPIQEYGGSACAQDGTLGLGEACEPSALGEADDCAAGGFCFRNVCTEICTVDPDTCNPGTLCGLFSSLFREPNNNLVGLCSPVCNAVQQNCPEDDGCYLRSLDGLASCTRVPAEAANRFQDDVCLGPAADQCYSNGCGRGFGTFFIGNRCHQFCTPAATGIGQLDNIRGDVNGVQCGDYHESAGEAAGTECRFFNSVVAFDPVDLPPNSLGICMSSTFREAVQRGSCETHDLDAPFTTENVENGTYVLGCEPFTDQAGALIPDPELRAFRDSLLLQMEEYTGVPMAFELPATTQP